MTKKIWSAVIIVAIASVAFYLSGMGRGGEKETAPAAVVATQGLSDGIFIGPFYVAVVGYDGKSFSPSSVSVPKGGAVIFKNNSRQSMRVASNPHPSHDGYPEKGGCVGSTFDSCANIPSGVYWSFTFQYPGQWGYHNHLNPAQGGMVTVK